MVDRPTAGHPGPRLRIVRCPLIIQCVILAGMTVERRVTLRKAIEEAAAEVQESIPYLTEAGKPVEPSVALGRLTRMEAISEKGVNEEMLRQTRARLERLRNALERMDNGTYGICPRCKGEIAFERLRAIPEVVLCVACARKPRR